MLCEMIRCKNWSNMRDPNFRSDPVTLVIVSHPPISHFHPILNDMAPGGRLNKKDGLTRYGDSHVKDKTS